jgi:hypothetical protein
MAGLFDRQKVCARCCKQNSVPAGMSQRALCNTNKALETIKRQCRTQNQVTAEVELKLLLWENLLNTLSRELRYKGPAL